MSRARDIADLISDGTLPPQTGNAGKYLTTDGTDPSWDVLDVSATSYQADEPTNPDVGDLWVESDVDSSSASVGAVVQYGVSAPSSPSVGDIWYDSTNKTLKVYENSSWSPVGARNNADPFLYNLNSINENITIPLGYNAVSSGPVTIANGVIVTISDGSAWSVV